MWRICRAILGMEKWLGIVVIKAGLDQDPMELREAYVKASRLAIQGQFEAAQRLYLVNCQQSRETGSSGMGLSYKLSQNSRPA